MELKTALYQTHLDYGGKMVPFAGYMLPVHYSKGIMAEHMAVRTGCGIFDVSHMGEIMCSGSDALKNLNMLMTNDFTGMADGQARYSPMCNDGGGIVDDLLVYRQEEDLYMIVVNASNIDKDYTWMNEHKFGDAVFENISHSMSQIAVQGPNVPELLRELAEDSFIPKKYYHAIFNAEIAGIKCIISATGYTGESGYEIYVENRHAPVIWGLLMEAGKEYDLAPCGLGSRDTLRFEAAMPLYGHEMSDDIQPLECGLGFAVKMNKKDFIGKASIRTGGNISRKRVGLRLTGKGISRGNETVEADGENIGFTTSGTYCPYLEYPAAMAFLDAGYAKEGQRVNILVRGRKIEAEVVKLPFYKKMPATV